MALTVTLSLTPDEQAALEAPAKARGVPVDSLLRKAVLQVIAVGPESLQPPLGLEQWEKEVGEWFDGQPNMPTLPDAAISREQIYTCENEALDVLAHILTSVK